MIATHARSYGRGDEVEDTSHVQDLVQAKTAARRQRGLQRLSRAVPSAEPLIEKAAERGVNLGSITSRLLRLLEVVPAAELEQAVAEPVARDMPALGSVRQLLDQQRAALGKPPAVLTRFAASKAGEVVVHNHRLESYDQIHTENEP